MKGLRKIMKIPPTHIDRSWTNRKVYQEANKELSKPNGKNSKVGKLKIKPVTELIDNRKIQLLGHIIRSNRNDPLKQVTFCDGNLTPVTPALRRVGRPRQKWNEYILSRVWQQCRQDDSDYTGTQEQKDLIRFNAQWRIKPFKGPKRKS